MTTDGEGESPDATESGRRGDDVSQRWARREDLALLTDYYQLTMMGGYWKTGRTLEACGIRGMTARQLVRYARTGKR